MGHPEKEGSHPEGHQKHEEAAAPASQHTRSMTLGESEKAVLEHQIAGPSKYLSSVRFLLSCTSAFDGVVLIVSAIAAIIAGAANPFAMLLLGQMGQSFRGFFVGEADLSKFKSNVNQLCLFYVYLAVVEFLAVYIATVGFTTSGEHIVQRIREKYLAAVLRQNIAYFEGIGVGEINDRITVDTNLIQDALTGKSALSLIAIGTFVSALVISFVKSWRLALLMLPALVLIVGAMSIAGAFMTKYTIRSLSAYSKGAAVVEEAITSIKTVTAFGIQPVLTRRYEKHIISARSAGMLSGYSLALMIAVMNGVIFWSYGLTFWQGSRWLVNDQVSLSAILTVLFATITGAFALGNVAPHTQAFVNGMAATAKISQTVCRESAIDPSLTIGERPLAVNGNIELKDVRHIYPSRPEVLVLDNVSLQFPAGQMTALVGPSGCGKSCILGLLERFYMPVSGRIYLDGRDITTLNLTWLRQQIGLVSQEPTLFATTVFENIRHGIIGTPYEHASLKEIEDLVIEASKTANAYDFINSLPDGFHTQVGGRDSLLSGGQQQRIAIARAIISNPRILLLDEATSALDVKAEEQVQKALNKAAQGRTTVVVAHRLSTIRDADNIVVMSPGYVVEQGTHSELIAKHGVYHGLVQKQAMEDGKGVSISDALASHNTSIMTGDMEKRPIATFKKEKSTIGANSTENRIVHGPVLPDEQADSTWALISFVFRLNKAQMLPMLAGLIFSVVAGASHPAQSIFLAKIISAMSLKPSMHDVLRNRVDYWCLMYLMIGFTTVIGWLGQGLCFSYYSQQLTYQARRQSLDTILHQDIEFFFGGGRSSGALASTLSSSAASLQGMTGVTLGFIFVILTTLVAGFVLAVAIGWKLGLVCACTIPIQLGCGVIRLKCLALLEAHSKKVYESSADYACEYSAGIRTVAALTLEDQIHRDYHSILERQRRKSLMSILQSSMWYAASQSLNFLCVALAMWYGSQLVVTDGYSIFQFFACYSTVVAGAFSAGAIFSFAPDIGKAKAAAQDIKRLFDGRIKIDSRQDTGASASHIEGRIHIQNVSFSYPNRPDQLVLDGIDLSIEPGQYIALVGASGSGKSTIISLLERFYDPDSGCIVVDGTDVRDWNIGNIRSHLALVGQMPTLYDGSIRENIMLGANGDDASETSMTQACKDADIYDFICSLPDGFNTMVGARGTMLSGGQRQRVAIARALLRRPKVLLLDEATSALDSGSEKIVQEALDKAAQGRTTIAVAHRISTVQNADCIYVMDCGRIVESGSHRTLMDVKGRYYELVKLQSIDQGP